MARAAFYDRFSSNNQREESIDAQSRATKEFEQKNGYEIVAEYADKAKTGTSDKRPEFLQMIRDAKKETLIVSLFINWTDFHVTNMIVLYIKES